MMNIVEEAIIYATIMHQGKIRKFGEVPSILHSMEVAQILATLTDDYEIITAGILHDVVDETDGTLAEIEKRFGTRISELVASDSGNMYPGEEHSESWMQRKEKALHILKNSSDIGVKMLWLADKLANIRSLASLYSEYGDEMWQNFEGSDPDLQCRYYRIIAEHLELSLNKTGAFKELIKHINFIWPGTFDSEKARYRKYKEVSLDGCQLLASGAKGEVYRYNDELVIKVFNNRNTYRDVEREIAMTRKAFIMGIPTAISFGIVAVGDRYGAMYELMDSETISSLLSRHPKRVDHYATGFAELAHMIHDIRVTEEDGFPDGAARLRRYLAGGVAKEDGTLAERCRELLETISVSETLTHGDFHTNNVFMQNGEPLLIDLDRLSVGHPMLEISDLYYFYYILGEDDPTVVENFMGYSYDIAKRFFDTFLKKYLDTEDEDRLEEVKEKASFICYIRMVNKIHKKSSIDDDDRAIIGRNMRRIKALAYKLETLDF